MEKDHDKNQTMTASPEWVTSLPEARDPDTCQMVVVAATGMDKTTASISMHERDADGRWIRVLSTPGFVGEDGLCMDEEHREDGPNCTPIGTYKFNKAFGIADDPGCNVFDYVKVDNDIYWSGDDRDGMHYNEMVNIKDLPDLGMRKSEHIIDNDPEYQYCLNISFNEDAVPGKGSAIFMHCFGRSKSSTKGCVAVPKYTMVEILQRVRPDCVVVIGVTGDGSF